ncbi:hypothetical protein [Alteromonas sp. CYL-A6]|uniref:hypothetical protein n=1 Tax=Alteromonas nitratireducens TaxID=3390813 RepID=UPI0034C4D88E
MYRWLIVSIEVVLLVTVLRAPFAQYLLGDIQDTVSGWIEEVATMPQKAELANLRNAMSGQMQAMRPFQRDYLNDVMQNSSSIVRFHSMYCVKGDKNPFITGASLRFFCSRIEETELLMLS